MFIILNQVADMCSFKQPSYKDNYHCICKDRQYTTVSTILLIEMIEQLVQKTNADVIIHHPRRCWELPLVNVVLLKPSAD